MMLHHQIENLFNIIRTYLLSWLSILGLGIKGICAGQRNSRDDYILPFAIFLTVQMTVSDKKLLGTCEIYEYLYTVLCTVLNQSHFIAVTSNLYIFKVSNDC